MKKPITSLKKLGFKVIPTQNPCGEIVIPVTRKLKATWNFEIAEDLKAFHEYNGLLQNKAMKLGCKIRIK